MPRASSRSTKHALAPVSSQQPFPPPNNPMAFRHLRSNSSTTCTGVDTATRVTPFASAKSRLRSAQSVAAKQSKRKVPDSDIASVVRTPRKAFKPYRPQRLEKPSIEARAILSETEWNAASDHYHK